LHIGFWWGLLEGTVFFIVPDLYISFATLFSIRSGAIAWMSSIAGSVTAVAIIYLLMAALGLDFGSFLEIIPGISRSMIDQVEVNLAAAGLPFTPLLVLGGVPLKVYAAAAFSLGLPLGPTLAWTFLARVVRIAPTFTVAASIRLLLQHRIDARPLPWTVVLGLFWLGFYVFYFWRLNS
jgi:hypothetical protein